MTVAVTVRQVYVTWGGLQCRLSTDSSVALDYLAGRRRLLGRGDLAVGSKPFPAPLVRRRMVYLDRSPEEIRVERGRVFLASPWERARRSDILECLLAVFFERELQLRGRFTVHGSAVALGRSAYLFMGPKEAGKTTMAYAACARLGAEIIANDAVIVSWENGRPRVQGCDGDVSFTFRSQALEEADPDVCRRVFGPVADGRVNLRKRVAAADLAISACGVSLPLRRVYVVGLGLTRDLDCRPLDPLEARVALHENIVARIRGVSLVLFDETDRLGPWLPDFSCPRSQARLAAFLNQVCDSGLVWHLRGPLARAVETVREHAADLAAT